MSQKTFETSASPTVAINARRGISVQGWNENRVVVEVDDAADVQQNGDTLSIGTRGDCMVRMPRGGTLQIERAGRTVRIVGVTGALRVMKAGDDLHLRECTGSLIDTVGGELNAAGIVGDVFARSVGQSAEVRGVTGGVTLLAVGGTVRLSDVKGRFQGGAIGGSLKCAEVEIAGNLSVGGSAEFRLNPGPEDAFLVRAGGSIHCAVANGARAQLSLIDHQGARELALGEGGPQITLIAGGTVRAQQGGFDGSSTNRATSARIDDALGRLDGIGEELGLRFKMLGNDFEALGSMGDRIAQRARRAAERATEKARRRAERDLERAQRRAQGPSFSFAWPRGSGDGPGGFAMPATGPAEPAPPPAEPVSDAERMAILRLVEQKKISVAQADQLLQALEG